MNKLEKYSAYKDSGVEWLGVIPVGWEVRILKFNANIFSGNSISDHKKSNYEYITKESFAYISTKDIDLNNSSINYDNGLRIPKIDNAFKIANKNSTLLCIEGGSAGKKIAFTNQNVCLVNKLACISDIKNNDSKYIYYLVKSSIFNSQFNLSMNGLIGGVSLSIIKNFDLIFPPKQEQIKIATFLDTKAAQLDKAIKQKQQLTELLKERQQILINDAVTKGLDKTVVMKDSGVEWIGEIPEHWEVKKLKYISKIVLGKMICNNKSGNMKLKPYLKSKNIQWLNVDIKSVDNMWFTKKEMQEYRLKTDDIILSEGGEVGKTCIWNNELSECYIQNSAHKVTINSSYTPHYYLYLLNNIGHKGVFEAIVNRVSIGHLTKNKLSNLFILLPSKKEQQEIVNYIEENNQKINKAIDLQQQQINKLKEYKTTLIDSLVTGKMRVCDE